MLLGKVLLQRYEVIEEIGSGAFGDTYIAIDQAFPGKPRMVVKHLCPNNSDPENLKIAKRLFETEAKVLSTLGENDQIPRLFSYFEEDGEFYLVQELVEGHTLSQEFEPGTRWSEAKTVKFLRELLEILSVVHQQGTIHRDLKPANIMRRQQDGKLVLIDFGAVKEILSIQQSEPTGEPPTVGIGTAAYLPPEQAMGRPGKYSDIYAVGMLGIQALTGLPSQDLPQDTEHLEQVWNDLNVQVDPQLKYVLGRMISYQYKHRFADAVEALKALVPTVINPSESSSHSSHSSIAKKTLLALLGVIGLAGAGITAGRFLDRPDYGQLETYLQNQEWQQADAETDRLMLQVSGETSALDVDAINKFPCNSLEKIDELWTSNSDGRFGFTPQEKAYLETGNEFNQYTQAVSEAFGDRVKWRSFGVWSLYGDLKFTNIAPPGHLPSPGRVATDKNDLRIREREMLLSRFDACGL
jgi:eukaryotic-like serine/threonine-protein kinase